MVDLAFLTVFQRIDGGEVRWVRLTINSTTEQKNTYEQYLMRLQREQVSSLSSNADSSVWHCAHMSIDGMDLSKKQSSLRVSFACIFSAPVRSPGTFSIVTLANIRRRISEIFSNWKLSIAVMSMTNLIKWERENPASAPSLAGGSASISSFLLEITLRTDCTSS